MPRTGDFDSQYDVNDVIDVIYSTLCTSGVFVYEPRAGCRQLEKTRVQGTWVILVIGYLWLLLRVSLPIKLGSPDVHKQNLIGKALRK